MRIRRLDRNYKLRVEFTIRHLRLGNSIILKFNLF